MVLSEEVKKNNIYNYVIRILNIFFALLYTRLTLIYLGSSLYGIWVTIASISSWGGFMDFGIGNGLRNELTKAIANADVDLQKKLIGNSIRSFIKISIFLFILLSIVVELLFYFNILSSIYRVPVYIVNLFFCINFIFGVNNAVSYSLQKSYITSLYSLLICLIKTIIIVILLVIKSRHNIVIFSFVNGFTNLLLNIFIFYIISKFIKFNLLDCIYNSKKYVAIQKNISNIGILFFVLQIGCVILYQTDNLIINYLFESEMVTKYSIITNVYSYGDNLFSIMLISLWSAVTYSVAKNDFMWIKSQIKKLLLYWILYSCGVLCVSFLFNWIIKMWLRENAIYYEYDLICLFAVYNIICAFGSIFVNVTNGLGRLKLQVITAVVGMILNIPLSYILAKNMGMGIFGVKLATLLCLFGSNVLIPIDIINFLHRKK